MEVSAFEIYQKRNKKRRVLIEHKDEPSRVSLPFKKKKKTAVNSAVNETQEGKILKKKKKKTITEKLENLTGLGNEDATSDEEIPILVPITDFKNIETESKAEPVRKLKKKKLSVKPNKTTSTNTNDNKITNGTSMKKPESAKHPVKSDRNPSPSDSNEIQVYNPVMQGLAIFKWLINPITPRTFFEKYWEKEVLHVKRSTRKYFSDVFSSEKLDGILRDFPLHFTRNIDVVAYQNGKKEVIDEEGRALPSKLWDFYSNGCSVRILNPQTYDTDVHSLIASLQEYFGTMVGTNAYLTPPDSQGFAPHFDDIEAFIVQIEGSKYWKLYKPREEDVLARDSSPNFKAEDLGAPFMEVKLEAGDLLYFPRGTIHEGRTKEEHSLHITVSMYQHTAYIDLLEQALPAALKKAASENVEFRKGLPLNYLKHLGIVNKNDESNKRQIIIDNVKSLVNSLVNYLDIDAAADNLGRKFMHDAMPPRYSYDEVNSCKMDGDYMENGKVYNRVEINPDIKIRLLRYYILRVVQESETTSKLYFSIDNANVYHGEDEQWLEIDNSLIPGIEMLQKHYPNFIVAGSLPIKDEVEKLSLISTLWEHGLLVTSEPLPICDSGSESNGSSVEAAEDLTDSD